MIRIHRTLQLIGLLAATCAWLALSPSLEAQEKPKTTSVLPPDLELLSSKASGFLCVRVAEYWNGKENKDLNMIATGHPVFVEGLKILDSTFGLKPGDIELAVVILPPFDDRAAAPIGVITTVKRLDRDKALGVFGGNAGEMKAKDKTYFGSATSSLGIHFASDGRTMVLGDAKDIHSLLERPTKELQAPWRGALESAAKKNLMTLALHPPKLVDQDFKNAPPPLDAMVPLLKAELVMFTVTADKDLRMRIQCKFSKDEDAKAGIKSFDVLTDVIRKDLGQWIETIPMVLEKESKNSAMAAVFTKTLPVLKSTDAALKDLQLKQTGSNLDGTVRVESDTPAAAFACLLSIVPRAKKASKDK